MRWSIWLAMFVSFFSQVIFHEASTVAIINRFIQNEVIIRCKVVSCWSKFNYILLSITHINIIIIIITIILMLKIRKSKICRGAIDDRHREDQQSTFTWKDNRLCWSGGTLQSNFWSWGGRVGLCAPETFRVKHGLATSCYYYYYY